MFKLLGFEVRLDWSWLIIAALVVWAVHSAVDWDWEMPALTLIALVLAGSLIAGAEREEEPGAAEVAIEPPRAEPAAALAP